MECTPATTKESNWLVSDKEGIVKARGRCTNNIEHPRVHFQGLTDLPHRRSVSRGRFIIVLFQLEAPKVRAKKELPV